MPEPVVVDLTECIDVDMANPTDPALEQRVNAKVRSAHINKVSRLLPLTVLTKDKKSALLDLTQSGADDLIIVAIVGTLIDISQIFIAIDESAYNDEKGWVETARFPGIKASGAYFIPVKRTKPLIRANIIMEKPESPTNPSVNIMILTLM